MPMEVVDLVSSQAVMEREGIDTLPEIFWENTKLRPRAGIEAVVRRIQSLLGDPRKVMSTRQTCKTYPMVPRLALPDPLRPRAPFPPFDEVVLSRRSAILSGTGPAFSPDPVPLERLGDLLYFTYGIVRAPSAPAGKARAEADLLRRVAPSGGALYPLELYMVAVNVEGLAPGVYHYNAYDYHLEQLRSEEHTSEL